MFEKGNYIVNSNNGVCEIRDIATMISYPNSATFTILTIDAYIWLFLLYSYYNYKEVNKNG